jgi:adenylate kinase
VHDAPRPALLLLGPTGSGKSPLGRRLERTAGFRHLDFGAHLRRIAAGESTGLDAEEREFVRTLVETNALFPDAALPLVRRIVRAALSGTGPGPVVLNGVPRTLAQAEGLADLLDVRWVVALDCSPRVTGARIERRHAGLTTDDAGRGDDTPAQVARKLELFAQETRPLVAHYRARGARVIVLPVDVETSEDDLARAVARQVVL